MENIALCVYTHNDCEDVWCATFGRLKKYANKFLFKYVCLDKTNNSIPEDYTQLVYDNNLIFSEKFESCLRKIKEKYIIYIHEDFILYDYVNFDKIIEYVNILENNLDNIHQIQLIRCGMPSLNEPGFKYVKLEQYKKFDLYHLPNNCKQYNGQATLWNKNSLIKVLENNKYGNSTQKNSLKKIIDMENPKTHSWMIDNNIKGLFHYNNNSTLRGLAWDSNVFPYISTAIRKGKWDLRQNKNKLVMNVIDEFKIDINKRGIYI